jgi:hypothetical protein
MIQIVIVVCANLIIVSLETALTENRIILVCVFPFLVTFDVQDN